MLHAGLEKTDKLPVKAGTAFDGGKLAWSAVIKFSCFGFSQPQIITVNVNNIMY